MLSSLTFIGVVLSLLCQQYDDTKASMYISSVDDLHHRLGTEHSAPPREYGRIVIDVRDRELKCRHVWDVVSLCGSGVSSVFLTDGKDLVEWNKNYEQTVKAIEVAVPEACPLFDGIGDDFLEWNKKHGPTEKAIEVAVPEECNPPDEKGDYDDDHGYRVVVAVTNKEHHIVLRGSKTPLLDGLKSIEGSNLVVLVNANTDMSLKDYFDIFKIVDRNPDVIGVIHSSAKEND